MAGVRSTPTEGPYRRRSARPVPRRSTRPVPRPAESAGPAAAKERVATRVLLAEDDPGISLPLSRAFRREGHDVIVATDGGAVSERAIADVDIVVLDLGLPRIDGVEVCRRARASGVRVPVIMLTAPADVGDAVVGLDAGMDERAETLGTLVGLDAGADDYLIKPFRLAELLACTRAALRPAFGPTNPEGSRLVLDHSGRRTFVRGLEVALTSKEFDILAALYVHPGRVVPRGQLVAQVWDPGWFGSSKTLDMHLSALRRKLGGDPSDPPLIITVRGVGFRLDLDSA